MGLFGGGSKDERHEIGDDCRPRTGAWWAKPNPVGWGSDDPRVIKRADRDARSENGRPAMHGIKAERELLAGKGAIVNWGRKGGIQVRVSGEKPGGGRQR